MYSVLRRNVECAEKKDKSSDFECLTVRIPKFCREKRKDKLWFFDCLTGLKKMTCVYVLLGVGLNLHLA